MLVKVISGGQTEADQGGLRAAKVAGVPTGGYAPRGWLTEAGPAPWLVDYGLTECVAPDYPARTRRNVLAAHAVLWFGNPHSPGGRLTLRLAQEANIDVFVVIAESTPQDVARWLRGVVFPGNESGTVLMVAGNRESSCLGIGAEVEWFVGTVLGLLQEG
jgi:hypothetical protein